MNTKLDLKNISLKEKVKKLKNTLKECALHTENQRKVPSENMQLLFEIGYFDAVKPKRYGGDELSFFELVDANIELAASCASTAWVAGLLSAHQWLLAMFPKQAQDDVWLENSKALICGSYAPVSYATETSDTYVLNGKWSFASGCDHAQWSLCAAFVPEGEGFTPAFLLVPATQYEIEDTWNVIGLAGTGSKTLVLNNVEIPKHRILKFKDAVSGQTPGSQQYSGGLFKIPLLMGVPSCLASVGVGAAQGALESYLDTVSARVTRGAVAGHNNKMAEFPTIQLRVAEAVSSIDAAREILLRDVIKAESLAASKKILSIDDRLISRRGHGFSVLLALRAVEALNASTGGLGLNLDNPVQRAWRDTNAVARHISMNWDAVGTMIGQQLLGLEPKGQF
ncbi:flavin-dependent monooxygenase [Acinetobacter bereziniae]|uniref:flavin-dependent monooxygenase n=1 Tax=Acinetobacter bereziniae TaxID=106648 RepID=UPI0032B430A9